MKTQYFANSLNVVIYEFFCEVFVKGLTQISRFSPQHFKFYSSLIDPITVVKSSV